MLVLETAAELRSLICDFGDGGRRIVMGIARLLTTVCRST